MKKIRNWLKDIRECRQLTQKEVADTVRIAQPVYCRIENGSANPKVETAKKIAALLGFDWTRFYESQDADLIGEPFVQAEGTGQAEGTA